MTEESPEPRLQRIGSGLYATIVDAGRQRVWRSPSALEITLPDTEVLVPGQEAFAEDRLPDGSDVFLYRFGVAWEVPGAGVSAFMFSVAEDVTRYRKEVAVFRRTLWIWLGGAAMVLLVVQFFVLRWSLKPLARAAVEVDAVESGDREFLENDHPREISGLTTSVNRLLSSERERQQRFRNDMGDLAHSLKTPLAVLRAWLDSLPPADRLEGAAQVDRINQSVEYHLRRSASGGSTFSPPIPVVPVVEEIVSALDKVYAEKKVKVTIAVAAELVFYGDRGDLMEVLGNVLDNAYKYCRGSIRVEGRTEDLTAHPGLRIEVIDDGAGFPDTMGTRVLERGVRADTRTEGHGIGLASVGDIVEIYGGRLSIGNQSPRGGRVDICFPPG
jgi:two-component system sensor histidine kinase PhoQ